MSDTDSDGISTSRTSLSSRSSDSGDEAQTTTSTSSQLPSRPHRRSLAHLHSRLLKCRIPGCSDFQSFEGLKGLCIAHTILHLPVQRIAHAPRSLASYQRQLIHNRPTPPSHPSHPLTQRPSPIHGSGRRRPREVAPPSLSASRPPHLTVAALKAEGLDPFSPCDVPPALEDPLPDSAPLFTPPTRRTPAGLSLELDSIPRPRLRPLAPGSQRSPPFPPPTVTAPPFSLSIPPSCLPSTLLPSSSPLHCHPPPSLPPTEHPQSCLPPLSLPPPSPTPSSLPHKRLKPLTPVEEQRLYRAALLSSLLLRPTPSPLTSHRLTALIDLLSHRPPLSSLRPLIHRTVAEEEKRRGVRREVERRLEGWLRARPGMEELKKRNVIRGEGVKKRSQRLEVWMRGRMKARIGGKVEGRGEGRKMGLKDKGVEVDGVGQGEVKVTTCYDPSVQPIRIRIDHSIAEEVEGVVLLPVEVAPSGVQGGGGMKKRPRRHSSLSVPSPFLHH